MATERGVCPHCYSTSLDEGRVMKSGDEAMFCLNCDEASIGEDNLQREPTLEELDEIEELIEDE